ncbi:phosphomannomutase/phosphoglucomutase [Lysobacter sp. TY2-98]|uniref:phosphomannomutase/phosphoglucomutase n=1 Tax=Lysobacter sp. TY2-98 TaxID=2290922 RepID=UPI000E20893D|nr:phosphomannomutase/phosphoglucomutase [Lysobacter sp. TY2-98]AXK73019.1 phosphomannomutase/phosphoglucomutase [Lysobacter sp. TY2-98]
MSNAQVDRLKTLIPLLAGFALLLAGWFGFNAWAQWRDEARHSDVQAARDTVVQAAQSMLDGAQKRFASQLASPGVQDALKNGQFDRAAEQLTAGWKGASGGEVRPATLDGLYDTLGTPGNKGPGYGHVAALEAAVTAGKPIAWAMRDGANAFIALAAPVDAGKVPAVALVRLPMSALAEAVSNADIGEDSYLALRQGSANLAEKGDGNLSGSAEAMAEKISGSDLRVAAAVPDVAGGPLGLGSIGCAIVALVFVLLAVFVVMLPKLLARRATGAVVEHDESPTLADVTRPTEPLPVSAEKPEAVKQSLALDRGIFRAYDIRGVVGQSLDAGIAELIGQAIGTVMQEQGLRDIVVGRDGRLSGPAMAEGLITGLRRAGRNVLDIGVVPTPVTYFGAYHLRAGSCVSITGSHNPPDYNGFKIVVGGETLSGDAIMDLYARIADDRLHTAPTPGNLEAQDIGEDYVQRIAADIQIDRPLKVVVDAGNGAAGEIGPRVLEAIGAEVIPLHCEIDGTFPNHHPDPSEPHNLVDLIQMVERLDADLGIAFDGDGDRLGVITRDGQNIFPDRLLMMFAADVLERNPGAVILFDVKCTGRLPGHILRHGGSPLMWKTGHSLIKAKMRETDAELAGEMSGHFFFKERWYGFDDGIYSAARLLEILAAQSRTPTETLNALPNGVSTPEIKVDAPNGNPHAFVDRFREEAKFEGARLSTIDGLRVDYADGWGLVRASNTTPILVMRFDADSADALARIQNAFREQLLALQPDLVLPF